MSQWWEDTNIFKFRVRDDEQTFEFNTYEEAEKGATHLVLKQARLLPPNTDVRLDIEGFLSDPTDTPAQWYYITDVQAELKLRVGREDD